ncbi:Trihelix transcription factor GT-2, partial [Cucurbita argyrosperma subsp. argyrosperma]
MLEISTSPENSAAAAAAAVEEDGAASSAGFKEESDRSWAGNRWPREETIALLKVRSSMDTAFRDASLKAPLWEEVSRKLAELGYERNAKKCKEKFENIYKYHKRTRDIRSGKPNGKNYRYFEQLEALDNHPLLPSQADSMEEIPNNIVHNPIPCSIVNPGSNFVETTTTSISTSTTSCSSKESGGVRKKKRKFVEFFERLMNEVIEKQEKLQRKFMEALEKCEEERLAREEEWRVQELARIKKERERLNQERSIAAAKDAALLSFLKMFSEQMGTVPFPESLILMENLTEKQDDGNVERNTSNQENNNNSNNGNSNQISSSSRWPKEEIDALIQLRTNLQMKYQENGPKGPLWEEMSQAMKKLGYDRSAKRCKEKWENINKYFKRVKERNKKRPEDSKTCPYFQQLDALYKLKSKKVVVVENPTKPNYELKPEELLMHMMEGQEEESHQQPESATDNGEAQNTDQNQDDDHEDEDEDEDNDEDYQIVAKNNSNEME